MNDDPLTFKNTRSVSRILDPRHGGREVEVPVEVRWDPLTGRSARLAHFGAVEAQPLDLEMYRKAEVKGFCPFCPENRDRVTPAFPPDLAPQGRLARGEALLVPNLYPYDVHSSVCIMTREHVVGLSGMTGRVLGDAIGLGVEHWRRILAADPNRRYPLMGWNYMPPSGGGVVHPHQQYLVTADPGNRRLAEMEASERFAVIHGRDYWSTLLEHETAAGGRRLGRSGRWEWLSAFAPAGLLGEILGVCPGVWTVGDLDEQVIEDLTLGLEAVFSYLASAGIFSFNAALLVGPRGQEHFAAHISLVPRTFLNPRDEAPDMNFLQVVLGDPVCVVIPEALARAARPHFG